MNATIIHLLKEHFAIEATSISNLEGYDSVNSKVVTADKTFVLKQYSKNKETEELLLAEHLVLQQLSKLRHQEFPEVIPTVDGNVFYSDNNSTYRLLSYIEGVFLGDIVHTPSLLVSLGAFLAKLNKQLQNEYAAPIVAKETQWDLQNFKNNYSYATYITNPRDRSLVDYFFLQFDEHVYPAQHELRKTIIHNDANDWNVLTKEGQVSGLIDFGDMCYSWQINEVAVAITYVMMKKENPLEIASKVIEGYHAILPIKKEELAILYYLVAGRLCTSVCNSAYTKTLKPDSAYITISEKPAWALLRKWLTINPIIAVDIFYTAAGFEKKSKPQLGQQLSRREKVLSGALSLSYAEPIQMNAAAFQYMYDTDGNTITDAYNNIMLVGHSHPTIVRSGQRAMAKLNTNTRYIYEELLEYSELLLSKFPKQLNKVFFVNSGSAASDLAIRMAMTHTKKKKLLVLEHGYHGNTQIGIDISHYKYHHDGGSGKQEYILETPLPNAYQSGFENNGAAGTHFAMRTIAKIDANNETIAAFIAEPIVGCGGQVPLAKGYLKEVYPKIRAQGGICISDEVQVGFGRLGDNFWGYEMHDVEPDMVILGKPMGNGHPIGAVVTTTEIAESFNNGLEFFSSFGGNPVSCAIGKAVLQVIENEKLQEHAKHTGDFLKGLLQNLQLKFSTIADVRGSGLFLGVEIIDTDKNPGTQLASHIKNQLRKKHILIGTDGPFDSVLKIKPPLSFTTDDCTILCAAIDSILSEFHKK